MTFLNVKKRAGNTGLETFSSPFLVSSFLSLDQNVLFRSGGTLRGMETFRRDSGLSLLTIRDLLESSLPTEEIHKQITNNDDSVSRHDIDTQTAKQIHMDRKDFSPKLSTLDEVQGQMTGDSGSSGVAGQTDPDQMTANDDSDPDSPPRNPVRSYIDDELPDLLRRGSPIRRRVSSPVSATLKQVKREVELSRQRSLKLKAQVDRLQQQNESGPGWSKHRDRVTEEIQSIVKLLLPLTDLEGVETSQPSQANPLDTAMLQLQKVARSLALNHTSQGNKAGEDAAILQQALRDRDEAIAKKQAMETELLRSKNEMMTLNNQLLEAVQSRLELSIELEAWKDDVQTILHHQLLRQQQEEQAQKKSRGFGVLRRSNKPLPPKPDYSTLTHVPVSILQSPSPNSSSGGTMKWRDKFKRGKSGTQSSVPESSPQRIYNEDNFQTVSLD